MYPGRGGACQHLKAKAVPGAGRQAAVDEACEQIERNLLLVGASAAALPTVEDDISAVVAVVFYFKRLI